MYKKLFDSNNRIKIIIIITIIVIITSVTVKILINNEEDTDIIAWVDQQPISVQEFNIFLLREVSPTLTYFKEKYDIIVTNEIWNEENNGEVPSEYAKNAALNKCVRVKMQQELMKKYKITTDNSFSNFVNETKKENIRRKEAIKKGQVVYGPEQFQLENYYFYKLDENMSKLKEIVIDNIISYNEEELIKYYNDNKEKYIKNEEINYIQAKIVYDENRREETLEQMKKLETMVKKEKDINEVVNSFDEVILENINLDREKTRELYFENNKVYTEILRLGIGDFSSIIEEKGSFYIIQCKDRKTNYWLYDGIQEVIKKDYMDIKYDEYIDELIHNKNVKIEEKVWNKIFLYNM